MTKEIEVLKKQLAGEGKRVSTMLHTIRKMKNPGFSIGDHVSVFKKDGNSGALRTGDIENISSDGKYIEIGKMLIEVFKIEDYDIVLLRKADLLPTQSSDDK